MDGSRFDELTKALSGPVSRRRIAGALLGVALAALGTDRAGARSCRAVGRTCREHVDCCSGACGKDPTGRRRCQCQGPDDCAAPLGCHAATCVGGVCGFVVTPDVACDDGDPCTADDVCHADGSCAGTPINCDQFDSQCTRGACNPLTGACEVKTINEGQGCNDGDACTIGETCQGGVCTGGSAVVCTALDQCHVDGTCNPATGQCSNPTVPHGTACTDGNPLCIDGACCTEGHEAVHGGCFQITPDLSCAGCPDACQSCLGDICVYSCGGSVDQSGNYLCFLRTETSCSSNADCPVGQACQLKLEVCTKPC
jgi:hypothetical protein